MHSAEANENQLKAIESTSPLTVVIAGPGTGKTYTLTQRINYLIQNNHSKPHSILAVTFTHKAAEEMKKRTSNNSTFVDMPTICTLHSFGLSFLQTHFKTSFTVIDDKIQEEIITHCLSDCDVPIKIDELINAIAKHKANMQFPIIDQQFSTVIQRYEKYLEENEMLEFDDLINKPLDLLVNNSEILSVTQQRYQHILVDEFQDLSFRQQELISLLFKAECNNLFIIGDPNQAIYGFRGAHVNGMEEFIKRNDNVQTITLSTNYRSGQKIIDASQSILDAPKQTAFNSKPSNITILQYANDKEEAKNITILIQQLLGGISRQNYDTQLIDSVTNTNYNFSDIAVLLRSRFQFIPFKQYLLRSGIPFQLMIDLTFLMNEEVLTLLDDFISLEPSTPTTVLAEIKKLCIFHEISGDISGVLIDEARQFVSNDFEQEKYMYLQYLQLLKREHQIAIPPDKVLFSTIHGAKGLEFPVVIIPGFEEGLIPYYLPKKEKQVDLSEEKRLTYVAMTRAKEQLYISHTNQRTVFGSTNKQMPSRYLHSIPKDLCTFTEVRPKKRKPQQKRLF